LKGQFVRLATYNYKGRTKLGLVENDAIVSISDGVANAPQTMLELIARWAEFSSLIGKLRGGAADAKVSDVELLAPVPRPGKILAIGLNYREHAEETGNKPPEFQTWFSKATTSVTGPYSPVELPAVSDQLDYEAELVLIVGKRARNVPLDRAHEVIFGYCVGNDVSVRDWQMRVTQWVLGKSFETHAPFGPWITTADEVNVGDLNIRCLVNDEVRQSSNTRHLIFNCLQQVAHLSQVMTLEPGDVLFTGTPSGVAAAEKPPRYMKVGDIVRVEIDKLGSIENRIVAGSTETVVG
jgi:2-keto-4-pentenoate hydratase/2-oxohepta-3-ene-1,7-dioic acid hydratase in catechol pathway